MRTFTFQVRKEKSEKGGTKKQYTEEYKREIRELREK